MGCIAQKNDLRPVLTNLGRAKGGQEFHAASSGDGALCGAYLKAERVALKMRRITNRKISLYDKIEVLDHFGADVDLPEIHLCSIGREG